MNAKNYKAGEVYVLPKKLDEKVADLQHIIQPQFIAMDCIIAGEGRMLTGPEPGLPRDAIASDLVWKGRRIRLFDTAGLRKRARISEAAEKLAASDAVRATSGEEPRVVIAGTGSVAFVPLASPPPAERARFRPTAN